MTLGFYLGDQSGLNMVQHSPTPGKSSLPDIIPPVDLPPEFERFLTKYTRDHGFKAAINWYQTELTASDVKDRDTAGLTKLEQILRHDTRFPATSISPHWVPKKDLGKGKYGVVVLWERKMGINKVHLLLLGCIYYKLI